MPQKAHTTNVEKVTDASTTAWSLALQLGRRKSETCFVVPPDCPPACWRRSGRRMLALALHHQMYQMHARFEGFHHACRRLVEHVIGHMIEEVALELEVDNELHMSPVAYWRKRPGVY